MERLLLRAKVQLKRSQRMRAGQTKVYGPNLRGGTGFTAQLRAQVAASTHQTESRYADRQESRLKRIDRHLSEKARSMNVALGFKGSSRPSSGDGKANQERETSLYRSVSVDAIGTGRSELNGSIESGDVKRALTQSTSAFPAPSGSSCALCHSSSIGYNLCCQFRDVIGMLEQERVMGKIAAEEAKVENNSLLGVNPGIRRTGRSRAGRTARADGALTTRPITMDGARDSESDSRLTTPHSSSTTSTTPPVNDRVLQLFAKEDAAMLGLIKFKQQEAYRALYDQTQPRVSLSPAAAYFRDRFKHVGLFMQMHRQQQQTQQDGISGHYQKLHADLYSAGSRRSPDETDYDSNYDSEDDYADSEGSEEQSTPVQLPASPPLDNDEKIEVDPDRLFPTPQELEQLTPVDTKAALALYVQNRTAMTEMLDGYAELVDSQMIPTLKNSLSTRNRGALVETLDFVARASEFVCARRVQVFVAKLLHAVAESDVGDFTSFEKQFDELVTEMQGAVNFIRFFLQTRASRRNKIT
ncbi:hypothetical protein V7S43_012541 [Phytophthora oleae]|uniref:Uncharacterized protein n=1 Tax=Phytophthora oleae TaxID=2107226 RepID=A0ABD3F893_9STRA